MKNFVIYLVCSFALFIAVALIACGGWFSLCGLLWAGVLYVSGNLYPNVWRSFWVSNIRILAYFRCL